MKPNFALNLSHEGISLLHRAATGWTRLGEVALDSPDLPGALAELRAKALALAPEGLVTKLVIPNSQVLYTELEAPGPGKRAREGQIREALVGLTPYDVAELVFDYRTDGDRVSVAVVADETLREAEAFAAEFRFNPVCFVSVPEGGGFEGEPFFGAAGGAAQIIGAGVEIEREDVALAEAAAPSKPAAPEPKAKPRKKTQTPPAAPPVAAEPEETAQTEPKPSQPEQTAPEPTEPAQAEAMGPEPKSAETKKSKPKTAQPEPSEPETPQAAPAQTIQPQPIEPEPVEPEPIEPEPVPAISFSSARAAAPARAPEPPKPAPHPTAQPTAQPGPPPKPAQPLEGPVLSALDLDDVPDMPAWRQASAARAAGASLTPTSASPSKAPASKDLEGAAAAHKSITAIGATGAKATRAFGLAKAALAKARAPKPAAPKPAALTSTDDEAKAMTVFGARNQPAVGGKPKYLGLTLTLLLLLAFGVAALWSLLSSGTPERADVAPELALQLPDEATSPARAPETETGTETGTETAAAPPAPSEPATAPGPETLPLPPVIPGNLTSAVDAALSAALPDAPPASPQPAPPEPGPAPAVQPPAPDQVSAPPPSRAEAERRYATSGIWELDPDPLAQPAGASQLGQLETAQVDAPFSPARFDPLPQSRPDARPATPAPPSRLRASFDLDARGLVAATPEGNLSPDGHVVFLARPPVVPGIRPGTPPPGAAPEPTSLPAETPEDTAADTPPETTTETAPPISTEEAVLEALAPPAPDTTEAPETTDTPDTAGAPPPEDTTEDTAETAAQTTTEGAPEILPPALSDEELEILRQFRPLPRPGAFDDTRGEAVGETDLPSTVLAETELAALRPQPRPPSIQDEALSDSEELDEADGAGNPLAVTASLQPPARPASIARAAAAAAAEERSAPPPADPPAQNVAAARLPSIPSTASVTRAATEENALRLNTVNLIGVYGSSSDRRALVRLRNGRYVKVEVGDRVDGGQVAAIGADELRYVKGGRNITLKIPRG